MKILIIDNGPINRIGDAYCTNNFNGAFLEELGGLGHSISYSQFVNKTSNSISVYDLHRANIKCCPFRLYRSRIWSYFIAYTKLIYLIFRYDFIYMYYPNSFKYIAFICRLFRKKYGIYIRGMQGVNNKVSLRIYKNAHVVLTVADYFTDLVNSIHPKSHSQTIRPMIPYKVSDIVQDRKYEKKSEYNILYLGRIDAEKGLIELIHAIKVLKEKYNFKIILNFVGAGQFATQLEKNIKILGIENFVYFRGPLYDDVEKMKCYQLADLYILPTYHEGFPRTLYEAMISGTPIITTFVGGIPSVMRDGYNCKKIEPRSIDSIVETLYDALTNYPEMGRLARNGSETVLRILQKDSHAQLLNKALMIN